MAVSIDTARSCAMRSQAIQIDDELAALSASLRTRFDVLPVTLREASARLESRIGLRNDAEGNWIGRLAPLTVLYPLLQAESFSGIDRGTARIATLAHLYLLIYAFAEDRRIDGQIDPDGAERAFADRMLDEGLHQLTQLPGYGPEMQTTVDELLALFASTRMTSYATAEAGPEGPLTQPRILNVASGRAAHGAVAVMALACAAGLTSQVRRRIRTAYDVLVTALQWSDDLSDWQEDLERREENLLLYALECRGIGVYGSARGRAEAAAVGRALRTGGLFDYAANQARRWYAAAASRQLALGCPVLARLINEKAARVDAALISISTRAMTDEMEHAFAQLMREEAGQP